MTALRFTVHGTPTCGIGGCDAPAKARGWCNRHYLRWRQYGDPTATQLIRGDDQRRFWKKVNRAAPDECWEFNGARDARGYGTIWFRGKQARAPRVAWTLANGQEIPDGLVVRHRCDNPPCVNPAHLELGTPQENDLDRVERKRAARGERNGGGVKLTEGTVRQVRAEVLAGATHRAVAERYGVARETVSKIIRGQIWSWVQ